MKNCVLCDSICKKKQMKSWMTAVKGRLNYDFKKLEHSYFFLLGGLSSEFVKIDMV